MVDRTGRPSVNHQPFTITSRSRDVFLVQHGYVAHREVHEGGGAAPDLAFQPDAAAVRLDDRPPFS